MPRRSAPRSSVPTTPELPQPRRSSSTVRSRGAERTVAASSSVAAGLCGLFEQLRGALAADTPVASALGFLTEQAAELLGVERAGLWSLSVPPAAQLDDGAGATLRCLDQFVRGAAGHSEGAEVPLRAAGAYLRALQDEPLPLIHAPNIERHPALLALREELRALKVTSALEVPIRVGGRLAGVLRLGHTGARRRFRKSDLQVAAALGAGAALVLELMERRRSERARISSEETLRLAIEETEDGLWDWDILTGELRVSARWCQMLGYDPSEVPSNADAYAALVHPDDGASVGRAFDDYVSGRAPEYSSIQRLLHKQGHYVWVRCRGRVVTRDENGRPLRFVGTNVDLTEQKSAEDELRRKNDQLEAIRAVQQRFIIAPDPTVTFEGMLAMVLRLTRSEYGFIAEVIHGASDELQLKTHAVSNVAWDGTTRAFSAQSAPSGMVFSNLRTLFGAVMTSGRPVIANNPSEDPRSGGLPTGHPAVRAFLGLPFFHQGEMLGVVGVANRKEGYSEQIVEELAPFLAACSNLTAALRARQRSRVAEQERDRFFEMAVDPLCILASDGRGCTIRRINPAFAQRLGYPLAEVRGRPLLDFIHPDDHEDTRAALAALRTGAEPSRFENRGRCRDGSVRWLSWNAAFASDSGDIYAIARDVTEQRQAREERRRLVALVENSTDCILLAALTGQITYANTAARSLLGITLKPQEALHLRDLTDPEERSRTESDLSELTRTGWCSGPRRFRNCQTGGLLFVEVMYFYTRDAQGEPEAVACVVRDVTERQRLTEQLVQAQKMEAVGRLAGGIAHDFNNILTAIQGCASLLQESLYRHPDADLTREILSASERAATLTRQLLAFSRKQLLSPMPVDLGEVLVSLRGMLQQLVGDSIRIHVVIPPEVAQVRVDPNRIEQVIVNLVVNARDAMPEGGELRIALRNLQPSVPSPYDLGLSSAPSVPAPDQVELSFTDTGHGMSEETRAHLFEPFFTTKGPGRGSGLGLATVYGIVTQSGGHISVESMPGAGTSFRLVFPVSTAGPAPLAATLTPPHGTTVPGGRERVLVVEDDKAVREMLMFSLRALGYEVFVAVDGLDALELQERTGLLPDLLLTDVIMPNLGGHDLARHMQQRQPGLRVLYMTGYTDDPELQQGLAPRSFGILPKPFPPDQLARAVRSLIDAPRQ